jgi:hypothetical protein
MTETTRDFRPPAVAALLGIGAIYSLQIVHALISTPVIGIAYGALIAASVAVAAWLFATGDVRAWSAAGVMSAVALLAWAFNNFVGRTFDTQDVGNWRFVLDLAPLFVETILLVLTGYVVAMRSKKSRMAALASNRAPGTALRS